MKLGIKCSMERQNGLDKVDFRAQGTAEQQPPHELKLLLTACGQNIIPLILGF